MPKINVNLPLSTDPHELGKIADFAIRTFADPSKGFHQDELKIGLLTIVECICHHKNWRDFSGRVNSWTAPILDYIIPQYPDDEEAKMASSDALSQIKTWIKPSEQYSDIVFNIINALKDLVTIQTTEPRIVFTTKGSTEMEKRNRWFEKLLADKALRDGKEFSSELNLTPIGQIRAHINSNLENIFNTHYYNIPTEQWFIDFADEFGEKVLNNQFLSIPSHEVWDGLNRDQTIKALKTLYSLAAQKYLAHLQLYQYLNQSGYKNSVIHSSIGLMKKSELVTSIARNSNISSDQASLFVSSLIRKNGDKNTIDAFPLISLKNDQVAFLPANILFGSWKNIRENFVAKKDSKLGQLRDSRYTSILSDIMNRSNLGTVYSNVEIFDQNSQPLTDLDLAIISKDLTEIFVFQLKSFVTPITQTGINKPNKDVAHAASQCAVADNNRTSVLNAFKSKNINLDPNFTLRQIIVVEVNIGTNPTPVQYPAVSAEWLIKYLSENLTNGSHQNLWLAAKDLPDGKAFMDSLAECSITLDCTSLDPRFKIAVPGTTPILNLTDFNKLTYGIFNAKIQV